jgi:hypothetical protein
MKEQLKRVNRFIETLRSHGYMKPGVKREQIRLMREIVLCQLQEYKRERGL